MPVEIRVVRVEYDGAPALLFHVRDITERRAAEMALRSSETLFRSVWENSVDGMRLTDENGIDHRRESGLLPAGWADATSSSRASRSWSCIPRRKTGKYRCSSIGICIVPANCGKTRNTGSCCTTAGPWSLRSRIPTWSLAASRACC